MATPMMTQYHRVKLKFPNEIIFFRMGDFFEMFHDDAIVAHEILGLTLTKRSHGKGEDKEIPLAGFPHHKLESYLAKMIRAGKRVVVVDQTEDPKKAKGLVKRDIVRVVTAGTSLGEDSLNQAQHQFLVAIVKEKQVVGTAFCDASTGEFFAASVSPTKAQDLLELFHPVEVLLPEDDRDELKRFCLTDSMITPLSTWIFDHQFAYDTLTSHFKVQNLKGFGLEEEPLSIRCAGAILHYLHENLRAKPDQILSISRLPTESYLILDSATRKNLELIDPIWGTDRKSTLAYHLLRTVTPFGKRLFFQYLLRPLLDKNEIEKRLDAVEEFVKKPKMRSAVRERLRLLGDFERLTSRLVAGRDAPRDAGALRDSLERIPGILSCIVDGQSELIQNIAQKLDPLEELVSFLKQALVDEPPVNLFHGGAIRDGFNAQLDELRTLAKGGKKYILARQEKERSDTGINSLTISYNKIFGYYIEVSKANLEKVPPHYIRKQTLVNAERYITPDLKEWEDKIVNAEEQSLELERELFDQVRSKVVQFAKQIQQNAHLLAEVDYYSAAGELATDKRYNRPIIRTDNRLILVHSRHPVIENLLPEGESFIVNDLDIGDENRQIALVTGPNMGGKSTYLRQVGLIVIMAQAGLFVPALEAQIPITDRIFTRVGASDNLAAGESTFLVEMQESANILHNSTNESLILLDEVGRGTSTFDGLSLAWAIVEFLHDSVNVGKPKTLFATHYHELTELETTLSGVFNLHVDVKEWGERIIFLRKVLPGRSGASYGIQVAQLAGLPHAIIERAKEVLESLESEEINEKNLPHHRQSSKTKALNIPSPQQPLQLTLFTAEERELRDKLTQVDIDNLTPLEALRLLAQWKEQYGKDDTKEDVESLANEV